MSFKPHAILIAISSWLLPIKLASGKVIGQEFYPSCIVIDPLFDITTMPSPFLPTYFPAIWWLDIDVAGERYGISVDQPCYELFTKGDEVMVEYVVGIFSGKVRVKNVRAVPKHVEDDFLAYNGMLPSNGDGEHF